MQSGKGWNITVHDPPQTLSLIEDPEVFVGEGEGQGGDGTSFPHCVRIENVFSQWKGARTMRAVTRREFLVDGSMLVGGTIGSLALGSELLSPQNVQAAKVEFPESSCGLEKKTGKEVLVAYASFCGTTGGVAEAIGQVLCDTGAAVDVRLVKNVEDLSSYKTAVIGSAVRSSSWWPDAIEFVKKNQRVLSQMPVAYFLTCLALYKDTEASRRVASGYMNPVLKAIPDVKPVDMGVFAGVLDYSKLNLVYRMVMKSTMKKRGVPEGDFRNWNAIRSWAKGLCSPLLGV
jgi:menaquinone-dependent protoporphyrinogen oxidase